MEIEKITSGSKVVIQGRRKGELDDLEALIPKARQDSEHYGGAS